MKTENTLVIGDRHAPFTHRGYLDFCRDVQRTYRCKAVVDVGDSVDQHAISYHEKDPEGRSAGDEWKLALKELKRWYKAFPKAKSCLGNHDKLIVRKAYTAGLPSNFLRSFASIYEAPAGWEYGFSFTFGNWQVKHGNKTSGQNAAFKTAESDRISTAIGHVHSHAGVRYHACMRDILWGMLTGCGIDRKAYSFAYGEDFTAKPILSCGVVLEGGTLPLVIPMPL